MVCLVAEWWRAGRLAVDILFGLAHGNGRQGEGGAAPWLPPLQGWRRPSRHPEWSEGSGRLRTRLFSFSGPVAKPDPAHSLRMTRRAADVHMEVAVDGAE